MTDLRVQMIFSPQNCSLEVLERTLTRARGELAEQLMAQIDQMVETGTACQNLVIGWHGSGKTHVLSYVLKKRGDTREPIVIRLPENDRGITSLLDFFLACVAAAGMSQEDIVNRIAPETGSGRVDAARDLFLEQIESQPALIVFENLSGVFNRLDEGELRSLRGFLQDHPHVSVLASSVAIFTGSSKPGHPFYDCFTIHSLEPLDRFETRPFLAALAGLHGQSDVARELEKEELQERVNAIHHLTGGNHRLLAMLARFLSGQGLKELVHPFVEMVDRELTPYYQHQLGRLSAQQNKILRAVASLKEGGSLAVKEVAHYTMLTSQVVSRQLYDLLRERYVVREQRGRESYYRVREPLLRLALDMKEGHGRSLPTIVAFLRNWYGIAELEALLDRPPDMARPYYEQALAGKPAGFTEEVQPAALGPSEAGRRLLAEGVALGTQGGHEEALGCFDAVIESHPGNCHAWYNRAVALENIGRFHEAARAYDEVVAEFGESEEPAVVEGVARALVHKGAILSQQGRTQHTIARYDEAVARSENPEHFGLLEGATGVFFTKGAVLHQLGYLEEALAVFDRALELSPQDAQTVSARLAVLLAMERAPEAFAGLRDALARDGFDKDDVGAWASGFVGSFIGQPDRLQEVVDTFGDRGDAVAEGVVVWLWRQLPLAEEDVGEFEEAEKNLKAVLGDVKEARLVLRMIEAVWKDAQGDTRALLSLPIELRKLVEEKKEEAGKAES